MKTGTIDLEHLGLTAADKIWTELLSFLHSEVFDILLHLMSSINIVNMHTDRHTYIYFLSGMQLSKVLLFT